MRPPELSPGRRRVLRWVAMGVSLTSVASVALVAVLVVRTESAFDEARCPFVRVSVRPVAPGVRVADERRQCTPDLVEHRWLALRSGKAPSEVGRRRLSPAPFAPGAYTWTAEPGPRGLVKVHLLFHDAKIRPSLYEELP